MNLSDSVKVKLDDMCGHRIKDLARIKVSPSGGWSGAADTAVPTQKFI
jgi:hypothetical protein